MIRPATLLTIFVIGISAFAQQLTVKSMTANPLDLTASTKMRRDLNNEPCALVKVVLCADGATFEGNIIGDTKLYTNEYWVYMTDGSKMLKIKHGSYKPLMVTFADYGINSLEQKSTYTLDIDIPQATAATNQQVIINYAPSTAVVLIDGKMLTAKNGTATAMLPADKEYSFIVAANGYESTEGTFRLKASAPTRLNVQLYPETNNSTTTASSNTQTAAPQTSQQPQTAPDATATGKEIEKAFDNGSYLKCMELCKKIPDNALAQYYIGKMHLQGRGTEKDRNKAIEWFKKSSDNDFTDAQCMLGILYTVDKNYTQAIQLLHKAAEKNHAEAQHSLGNMYCNGEGVGKNDAEGARWFKKSAENGNTYGMTDYAILLYRGRGVPQNVQEAYRWLKKAADAGNLGAKDFLSKHTF